MIYIFETSSPRRYFLNINVIKQEKEVRLQNSKIDLGLLKEVLESQLGTLPEGWIRQLCEVDNIRVLIWDFKEFTPCSDASESDFSFIDELKRPFDLRNSKLKTGVGLNFFTLGRDKHDIFDNEELQIVKTEYVFPEATELERLDAFRLSLYHAEFYVNSVKSTKSAQHLCEFSGGGDVCVTATKETSVPMVILASPDDTSEDPPQTNDPTTSKDLSPTESPSHKSAKPKLSPLVTGNLAMVIEGKKFNFDKTKHKYQLWANMIVVVVRRFISTVESFDKTKLLNLKELNGYGMACAGDGTVGVYKLEIDMTDSKITFVTKLDIGRHQILRAAEIIDYSLDYYKKIIRSQ